ncbi:MAG TPA: glycosyltransferase [Bacteroidia bacterium]|nr:glycosyltransferase [Bacteroidia bacterium]HNT79535.1 glycosyltransferase [Bacteroidia bacterium]
MRILICSEKFCYDSSTFLYNQVIELSKKHTVKYVCSIRENEDKFPYDDVEIIPYKVNPLLKKIRWYKEIYDISLDFKVRDFFKRFNRIIEDFKPDLIHFHFAYEAFRFIANMDKRYLSIPYVITFHGYDATMMLKRKSYVKLINKYLNAPNAYAHLVCDFFREGFKKYQVKIRQADTIYLGIDVSKFNRSNRNPWNSKTGKITFVQISNFQEKKGHEFTIRAFKIVKEKYPDFNWQLIFAGGGMLIDEIKKLVDELNLSDQITFTGFISPSEAQQLLDSANVFVHHSVTSEQGDTEGCTNSIMEAMAMELPVLSTYHGGIPEMMDDGVHGFLLEEKDIEKYSERIYEIRNWSYKKECRDRVLKQFNLGDFVSNLEAHFQNIVSKHSK